MGKGTIEHRAGVLVSALVAFILITDRLIGLLQPDVLAPDMASDGWGPETLFPVAMLAFVSGVLYAVPRTAVLGDPHHGFRRRRSQRTCVLPRR